MVLPHLGHPRRLRLHVQVCADDPALDARLHGMPAAVVMGDAEAREDRPLRTPHLRVQLCIPSSSLRAASGSHSRTLGPEVEALPYGFSLSFNDNVMGP